MQAMIAINIILGDRSYRIKIEPKNEEPVRMAVKTINDQIVSFRTQFSGKDMQDYVAMVLIWFATRENGENLVEQAAGDVLPELEAIEKSLDKVLDPKKEYK